MLNMSDSFPYFFFEKAAAIPVTKECAAKASRRAAGCAVAVASGAAGAMGYWLVLKIFVMAMIPLECHDAIRGSASFPWLTTSCFAAPRLSDPFASALRGCQFLFQ